MLTRTTSSPKLATVIDLSLLKSIDITLDRYINLFVDLAPSLIGLERLFARVSPLRLHNFSSVKFPTDCQEAITAVLAVKPLKYLCLRGLRETTNLHRILAHHGPTLHGLSLEPYERDHHTGPENGCYRYPKWATTDIALLAETCPNIVELRIQIRRTEGNAQECELYRALGRMLPKLRTLILDLHFDPREEGPDAETMRKMRPVQFEDEEVEEIIVDAPLFRTTLINAATDETLALGIWNLISRSQSSRFLQNLRIAPFGLEMYSIDECYYLIFLARSFLVSRSSKRDENPSVNEMGKMGWTVWQEENYGPVEDCELPQGADEVVALLWPALVGRDSWETGWASFPLEDGVIVN
ncbi:hypothetical protein BJY01DRAFT_248715 [Aspergillus pseudoustus]|uniref:F-box domain-containing protein n=1 Tax=Aspergillus pseudoustus TaxID=1810923 RepID=A0ABR4JU66_9EURO